MKIMPKPELERGNYIAYADEPGTVISGSGGGGGAVFLEADYVDKESPLKPKFSFNDVKNALDAGKVVFIKYVVDGVAVTTNYKLVYSVSINETPGDEAYIVSTVEGATTYSFISTDPNATMTDDSH